MFGITVISTRRFELLEKQIECNASFQDKLLKRLSEKAQECVALTEELRESRVAYEKLEKRWDDSGYTRLFNALFQQPKEATKCESKGDSN